MLPCWLCHPSRFPVPLLSAGPLEYPAVGAVRGNAGLLTPAEAGRPTAGPRPVRTRCKGCFEAMPGTSKKIFFFLRQAMTHLMGHFMLNQWSSSTVGCHRCAGPGSAGGKVSRYSTGCPRLEPQHAGDTLLSPGGQPRVATVHDVPRPLLSGAGGSQGSCPGPAEVQTDTP